MCTARHRNGPISKTQTHVARRATSMADYAGNYNAVVMVIATNALTVPYEVQKCAKNVLEKHTLKGTFLTH